MRVSFANKNKVNQSTKTMDLIASMELEYIPVKGETVILTTASSGKTIYVVEETRNIIDVRDDMTFHSIIIILKEKRGEKS